MQLYDELKRIQANSPVALLSRQLSRAEIDSLVAGGAITPLANIPRDRCSARVSVPMYRKQDFGQSLKGRI